MGVDRFAATVADTLLGPDQQSGRNLMRIAVRLLAHGKPVTVTELATAAGVDVADVSNAPAEHDIEYDDQHRIIGGTDPHPNRIRSSSTATISTRGVPRILCFSRRSSIAAHTSSPAARQPIPSSGSPSTRKPGSATLRRARL